jgi:hypothetical protein
VLRPSEALNGDKHQSQPYAHGWEQEVMLRAIGQDFGANIVEYVNAKLQLK